MTLPAALPAVPTGFKQQMTLHLNFGREGASAVFTIHDPSGAPLPITYRYKTDKRHDYEYRGYSVRGSDVIHKTWGELAAAWPTYYKAVARLVAAGRTEEQAMAELDDTKPLTMITIYERPRDYPDGFLVRQWNVGAGVVAPGPLLGTNLPTIDAARELVPSGHVNIGRTAEDDAKIVETWV